MIKFKLLFVIRHRQIELYNRLKETFFFSLLTLHNFICSKKLSNFVQILYFVLDKDGHFAIF